VSQSALTGESMPMEEFASGKVETFPRPGIRQPVPGHNV
jgi:hypothetical protein